MDEPATATDAARAELVAAGFTITPAGADRARDRRLDVLTAWTADRRRAALRRARAAVTADLPPGDTAHHAA